MENLVFEHLLQELPPLLSLSGMFMLAKFLFLHLTLAFVVYRDAASQERCALDIPPLLWGFMVLVGPIFGLLVYWLMHHSALIRHRQASELPLKHAAPLPLGRHVSRSARVAHVRSRRSPDLPAHPTA
jgi:hypothetical protein